MKHSLSAKIIRLVLTTALAMGGTVLLATYALLFHGLNAQATAELCRTASYVQARMDAMRERCAGTAFLIATRPDVIAAVKAGNTASLRPLAKSLLANGQLSVLTIADKSGVVLARGHSDKSGDSVLSQINVKRALLGDVFTGIEMGTVVKLSLRTGYPIRSDREVVGSVTTGIDLSSNYAFVDEIKLRLGVDCTIFHNDIAVSTTVLTQHQRAIEVKETDPEVIATVLQKGQRLHRVTGIAGRSCDVVYWPLLGADGTIVGMMSVAKDRESIRSAYRTVILSILISVFTVGALMIAGAYLMTCAMTRPITAGIHFAQGMAQGDLTQRLDAGQQDEIGLLSSALNQMASNLSQMVKELAAGVQVVSSASAEIVATSREHETTVNELQELSAQIAAAVTEISATSRELAHTMDTVRDVSAGTATLADQGRSGLSAMQASMDQLAQSNTSISSRLSVINERAENVNTIVTAIQKIAEQTNLLALNAAIEAEKAGEFGEGFSVVAREIRRLADQTSLATTDIERMVKDMQSSVSAGVMEMDKFTQEVQSGVRAVGEIGTQFSQIITQVQDLTPRFEEVNDGMKAQAKGAEQINEAMTRLTAGTKRTSESLRQSQKAADQLRDTAHTLHAQASRFRVLL